MNLAKAVTSERLLTSTRHTYSALDLTDGTGADVAFECAGVNAILDTMLDAICPAGVVNVSIWGGPATADMQKLGLKEIDLRGTIAYVRDHPAVIRMVQEGKVGLKPSSPAGSRWRTWWNRASTPESTTRTRR